MLAGPRVSVSLGKYFEPYLETGLTLRGILVSHRETTAFQGDARYERLELNMGAGITAGTKLFTRLRNQALTPFLNFGSFFTWNLSNYTRVTSTYDAFAYFRGSFALFEIRPFLTAGLIVRKEKKL